MRLHVLDVSFLLNYMAQDMISEFFFGYRMVATCFRARILNNLQHGIDVETPLSGVLSFLTSLNFFTHCALPTSSHTSRMLHVGRWKPSDMTAKWMNRCDPEKAYLLTELFRTNMSREEISAEVMNHKGAGHEMTGTTLTLMIDHLSNNSEHQAKLREELEGVN
jgi:hypothetical protein